MKKYIRYFYYFLCLSPIIGILLIRLDQSYSYQWYLRMAYSLFSVFLLLEMFLQREKIFVPDGTFFLLLYGLYQILWGFINGMIDRRGIFVAINNIHLQTALMLIVSYNVRISDKQKSLMIKMFFITIIVSSAVSIVQIFIPSFLHYDYGSLRISSIYTIRRTSIFGNLAPLELGLSFLPILAIVVAEFIKEKRNLVLISFILGGIVAILSNTRWVMGGYAIILLMVLFRYRGSYWGTTKTVILSSLVLVVLVFIVGSLGYDFGRFWEERLLSEGSLDRTTRYYAFENFKIFFPRAPWFGTGVGQTEEIKAASAAVGSSQIHVGYFAHLVYYGLVGSFLLFGFWFRLSRMLYRNGKKTGYWGSFFGFLVFLWGNATFVHFEIFYYGMIMLFIFDKYYLDKHKLLLTKSLFKK